jgi:2',3'-cyclic-nucleotide 2'-phosphodiesterase / 3'-nucleotidase / 5'-nucleotidase
MLNTSLATMLALSTVPLNIFPHTAKATEPDALGNVSAIANVTVADETAPVAPIVNEVTDKDAPVLDPINNTSRVLSGSKAEPGSRVYIVTSYVLKMTLIADSEGKFSTPLVQSLKEGTVLYVFCIDSSFNLSSFGYSIVSDVIAPDKPVIKAVSNKDKVVTGTAEVGTAVTVSSSKGVLGKATTDANGKFSVAIAAQYANTVLTVAVSDPSDNKSQTAVTVLDKIAPVVTGVVNNGIYNKNLVIKFNEGTATLDGKVHTNGTLVAKEGAHTLVVTDAAGNKTTVKFTIDKTAPKVTGVANNGLYNKDVTIYFNEGKALLNGQVVATKKVVKTDGNYSFVVTDVAGNRTTVKFAMDKKAPSTPSVGTVTAKSTKVTGKAEAYSTVVVKVGGKVIGSRTADKYGKFSITIAKQKAGKVVEVTVIDKAGNVSIAKKVTVKK